VILVQLPGLVGRLKSRSERLNLN